jgi:pimeloyl-ACP methyl ester carboxylesterase
MRIAPVIFLVIAFVASSFPAWAAVRSEYLDVPGWAEPNTPPDHNKQGVLRYWDDAKPATAAAIFIPGNGGGASSFDMIGRWLVANAGIEVWAVDRRSNHLEDHAGTEQALKTGNIVLGGMYYTGGGAYKRILPGDVPYLKHWGLRTHLNDIGELVKQIQARGIKNIFLGGHSLGALMTQAYAAFELPDGRPAYKDLRGLILFDGSVRKLRAGEDLDKRIAEAEKRINEGAVFAPDQPQAGQLSELIAIAASLSPDVASPIAPFVQDRTKVTAPVTNLALFGAAMDTDYKSHALCRCGRLADADPKNPGAPLSWVAYDKCGEVTDAVALAKALVAGRGAAEWYQPSVLMLDVGKASAAWLDLPAMGLKHEKEMDLPVIGFLANAQGYDFAEGMKEYAAAIKGKPEIHPIDPPGTYAHLDPLVAADADKRVFTPLKEWMQRALGGGS